MIHQQPAPNGVRPGFNIPTVCRLELQDYNNYPLAYESGEGAFKKSVEFINNMGQDIFLGERNGIKMILKPRPLPLKDASGRHFPPGIYVVVAYQYKPDLCIFSLPDPTLMSGNQRINMSWNSEKVRTEAVTSYQFLGKNLTTRLFVYVIEPGDFHRYPSMYMEDIDYVVSVESPTNWTHPYSPDGVYARGISEGTLENITNPNIFSFNVEIVAEEGSVSTKYVNIGNHIYQVKVNHQTLRPQGVYITYNKRMRSDGLAGLDHQDTYPLSELNKGVYGNKEKSSLPILFYNTAEDAMLYGDPDKARDIELKQLKKELEDRKIEQERLKMESDQLNHERKIELDNLKHERDQFERELEYQEKLHKHQLEMAKMNKQESIEAIKYVPAVLGVVLSILAFYTKVAK